MEPGRLATRRPFELAPGQSVTLPPGLFHSFWASAEGGSLVCGEVSTVSDAYRDNLFGEPAQRFMAIEEDEAPAHLLSHEYPGKA